LDAFFALGRFATADSRRCCQSPHVGSPLRRPGIAERLAAFACAEPGLPGADFLREAVAYGTEVLKFDPDGWVLELATGAAGEMRPTPERMLPHCEEVARAFVVQRLSGGRPQSGPISLFATDGGRAGIGYAVRALLANRLLSPGERVAVAGSILLPYLEFPELRAYGLDVVEIRTDPDDDWQFPDTEIDKLLDPSVKAFFLANPGNPHQCGIRETTVQRIASIVRLHRPDLLLVSDESFGTFVEGFRSLADALPASTLTVYSFGRHLGSAGARLAILALHQDNAFDCALDDLPKRLRRELQARYAGTAADPRQLRFMDRVVAESRSPALRHAAGLSLPQQAQLALFALFFLTDAGDAYIDAVNSLLAARLAELYRALGLARPSQPGAVPYYAVLDVLDLARRRHGEEFAARLRRAGGAPDFVAALRTESVVVLPGTAADTSWLVRVSLAACTVPECAAIGSRVVRALDQVQTAPRGARKRGGQPPAAPTGQP
jgi:aspartate 4-decarboxylase